MANVQITYGASSTLACTLASLASDSNLVAGRESAAFDNSAAQNTDVLLAGKITTGSAPTGGEIRIYVAGSYNDTPLWPDSLAGANAARTMTSYPIRDAALKFAAAIYCDTTSGRTYFFGPVSVAALFGGVMPKKWSVFIAHSTGVALSATAADHGLYVTPVTETVA